MTWCQPNDADTLHGRPVFELSLKNARITFCHCQLRKMHQHLVRHRLNPSNCKVAFIERLLEDAHCTWPDNPIWASHIRPKFASKLVSILHSWLKAGLIKYAKRFPGDAKVLWPEMGRSKMLSEDWNGNPGVLIDATARDDASVAAGSGGGASAAAGSRPSTPTNPMEPSRISRSGTALQREESPSIGRSHSRIFGSAASAPSAGFSPSVSRRCSLESWSEAATHPTAGFSPSLGRDISKKAPAQLISGGRGNEWLRRDTPQDLFSPSLEGYEGYREPKVAPDGHSEEDDRRDFQLSPTIARFKQVTISPNTINFSRPQRHGQRGPAPPATRGLDRGVADHYRQPGIGTPVTPARSFYVSEGGSQGPGTINLRAHFERESARLSQRRRSLRASLR